MYDGDPHKSVPVAPDLVRGCGVPVSAALGSAAWLLRHVPGAGIGPCAVPACIAA